MNANNPETADGFSEHLTQALEHFTDAVWLGEQSPLATPYFLGDYLRDLAREEAEQAKGRGRALQRLLREVADLLGQQDEQSAYYQRLITLRYFQAQKTSRDDIAQELGVARATLFRHLKPAIQRFEEVLVQRLHPALRLESPVQLRTIAGRDEILLACLADLQQNKTVALAGPGGIGKTMLAAHLAAHMAPRPIFWFTFHPGLNDHLSSLLFSLAYFLERHGAPDLWFQLVADQGQIDLNVVPGLLRYDLKSIEHLLPLLCFDEVDLLRPEIEAHAQILNFIKSFPEGIPVLAMGQQISIIMDEYYELAGLSTPAIHELITAAGIRLSLEHLDRLAAYTQGNPRLLALFMALHQQDEPLSTVLANMTAAPTLEALLNRVWRRLTEQEQRLVVSLAVYRRPVPIDGWPDVQERLVLQRLIDRQLVQSTGQGAVTILPIYRQTIYDGLSPENREILHLDAATLRASMREYTASAYHYIQAERPDQAVRLWYDHRVSEINQGQADAALSLFRELSQSQLAANDQERLSLIRAELWNLKGNQARAWEDLHATLWRTPILKARARRLEGDLAELSGELETAAHAYQDGLVTVAGLVDNEVVLFHRDLGWIYRRQKHFEEAWREALLARYEVENLQGHIQRDQGHLNEARMHYEQALALAQQLGHTLGEAKTHNVLAIALAQGGELDAAVQHWEKAYRCFERIGKQSSLASVRVNQATGHEMAGRPQQAILAATEALRLFERFEQPYGIAMAAQAMAEAHLATGQPQQAERWAWRALETEEASAAPDALRALGEARQAQQDLVAAEQYIRQAIEEAQRTQNPYLEAYAWRALGRVYLERGQSTDARDALQQASSLFEEMGMSREVDQTREVLHQAQAMT